MKYEKEEDREAIKYLIGIVFIVILTMFIVHQSLVSVVSEREKETLEVVPITPIVNVEYDILYEEYNKKKNCAEVQQIEKLESTIPFCKTIDGVKALEIKKGLMYKMEEAENLMVFSNETEVKIVNKYFQLYTEKTGKEEAIVRVVDIADIRKKLGVYGKNWVSFECCESIPNRYAVQKGIGYMNKKEIDQENQMYRGRHMVAVGAGILSEKLIGKYVTAEQANYGTFIDVVVKDRDDNFYYIPCVIADYKAHTYPNGYVQTGRSLLSNGKTDYYPEHADNSTIEFTASMKNADGSSRTKGFCDEYTLEEIIVYSLEYSISK